MPGAESATGLGAVIALLTAAQLALTPRRAAPT
jgi:hypothetical protein